MNIQPIQNYSNCTFGNAENRNSKVRRFYRNATGAVLATGICCLASDRLFKNPKQLPSISRFGFWASWAGLAMIAISIGKSIYDKAMASKPED